MQQKQGIVSNPFNLPQLFQKSQQGGEKASQAGF